MTAAAEEPQASGTAPDELAEAVPEAEDDDEPLLDAPEPVEGAGLEEDGAQAADAVPLPAAARTGADDISVVARTTAQTAPAERLL